MTRRYPCPGRTLKATWPGVWPGVGRMRAWSPMAKSLRDDLGPFGLDHRQHAVGEWRHFRLGVLLGPIVELVLAEHVARVREGRHPAAVFQPRVPADMVDMQMRAHHVVDVADGKRLPPPARADRCRRSSCSISGAAAAACRCRCSCRPGWCGAASSRRRTGSTV